MDLDRTFAAILFDWDGTAVPDRRASADAVRAQVEALCGAGVHVVVVSGTHVGNIDEQLAARPKGPGTLHLALNRGSEVFRVTDVAVELVHRRTATAAEDAALDDAAARTVDRLRARGIEAAIVSERLNRRKIDLLPGPEWADPPKARIAELLEAAERRLRSAGLDGLPAVVALAAAAAEDAGLVDPRITSDVKHVEIGLTDKSDSGRWAAGWLAERGITGRLVLVIGDEVGPLGGLPGSDSLLLVPELERAVAISVGVEPGGVPAGVTALGGGPARFGALLDEQLERHRQRRVPNIDDDPAWIVPLPGAPIAQRVAEALGTLANGSVGLRAALEEAPEGSSGLFVANGVYSDGPVPHLQPGPVWTGLGVTGGSGEGRTLDLRTGVLLRADPASGVRTLRLVAADRPDAGALRAEGPSDGLAAGDPFAPADDVERHDRGPVRLARRARRRGGGITVATCDHVQSESEACRVERLAAWAADDQRAPTWDEALERLADLEEVGFERLLAEQREGWARRWAEADVRIEGDPVAQVAARFAVFHLLGTAPDSGEAAVGPRGLTGAAYGGHVFWDADVFVLPCLAALRPAAARAMLEYRVQRLGAARATAAERGLAGARFPWESAADGTDVTPREVHLPDGQVVRVRTGELEEHIVADVAWAACEYAAWTGDRAFLEGPGRGLLLDTARWWSRRVRLDDEGRGHLYGVMGPDEYHEVVDDNAYTNVMARWNLRRAAGLLEHLGGDRHEAARWRAAAASLVNGWDPDRGAHEQFAGYWRLEPLVAESIAPRPFAADLVLGSRRVARSQLVKQPDVLMLHHLLPDELQRGSLPGDLAWYEPRTTHGSSLSPAICASLLARGGDPDRSLEAFHLAARLDLDDRTGTTAGGLHLATMGGLWQALAFGYLGLRPLADHLVVDPCLPSTWEALEVRLQHRGRPLAVRASHDAVTITTPVALMARVAGGPPQRCAPPCTTVALPRRGARERRSR